MEVTVISLTSDLGKRTNVLRNITAYSLSHCKNVMKINSLIMMMMMIIIIAVITTAANYSFIPSMAIRNMSRMLREEQKSNIDSVATSPTMISDNHVLSPIGMHQD